MPMTPHAWLVVTTNGTTIAEVLVFRRHVFAFDVSLGVRVGHHQLLDDSQREAVLADLPLLVEQLRST